MTEAGESLLNRLAAEISVDYAGLADPSPAIQPVDPFDKVRPYSGTERRKRVKNHLKESYVIERDDLKAPIEYLETAAYYFWQSRDCPMGDPQMDWKAAEKQWQEQNRV